MQDTAIGQERKKFEEYLLKSGLKFSRGRQGVFGEVMSSHGHFTAEDIAKHCQTHKPKVSRATVYRTIHELLESGIIRGTAFGEKHQIFEHIYDEQPHHHARCIHCHELIEFPDKGEDRRYHPLLEKQGFKVLGHEMHFYGICKKCR